MPTSEPMTTGEIARYFERLNNQWNTTDRKLDEIVKQLNDKPGREAFSDFKADQATIHANMDKKIDEVDARRIDSDKDLNADIDSLDTRIDKLLFGIIGTALAAAVNFIININGG